MALEFDRRVKGHIPVQQVVPRRHQHRAPRRGGICRLEGGGIVAHPVAHRTKVAHIDLRQHVPQKDRGDILDHDIVDPHHAARRPGQVQPEMPIDGPGAPDHIDPAAVAAADDRADLDHLAIGRQRDRRPGLCHAAHPAPARLRRIACDPHRRQVATHRLHPRRDPQIAARQQRGLPHVAQPLRGLRL